MQTFDHMSSKAFKAQKMQLSSKLLVVLHPQWAPFAENSQNSKQKVKKKPFFCFSCSRVRDGALQKRTSSLEGRAMLLKSFSLCRARVGAPQGPP